MDQHRAFIAAICAAPHDDAPRLVYADWLEENGEGKRAEFIRVQIESERLPPFHDGCRLLGYLCDNCRRHDYLRRRAHILWKDLSPLLWPYAFPHQLRAKENTFARWMLVSRGFVKLVTSSFRDWEATASPILFGTPLRDVRLTTWLDHTSIYEWAVRTRRVKRGAILRDDYLISRTASEDMLRETWPGIVFAFPPLHRDTRPARQETTIKANLPPQART